jgi:hypothetical protein
MVDDLSENRGLRMDGLRGLTLFGPEFSEPANE